MVGLLMSSVNRCFSVRLTEKLLQKTKFIPKLVNKDAFSSTRISKSRWFLTRIILGKDANFGASYFFLQNSTNKGDGDELAGSDAPSAVLLRSLVNNIVSRLECRDV